MKPRIEHLVSKKLIGQKMTMSLVANKTGVLWRNFMPKRREIQNAIGRDLFSLQIYDPSYFANFDPHREFEKWAAVEVTDFDQVPPEMETMILPEGLYAVFMHQGPASTGQKTFETIFTSWLPNSEYTLDNRPHFELLGAKYKNEDPESEEEFWIPVKAK
ncbi:MAG: GyrI-like domain-containing protein [Ardenticatenaceae bacterium]|nr:GyrI-like domain-containing protein [Ardenticatenaceae bacterium]